MEHNLRGTISRPDAIKRQSRGEMSQVIERRGRREKGWGRRGSSAYMTGYYPYPSVGFQRWEMLR